MGDNEFARERLGIWPDDGSGNVIPMKLWEACADPTSRPDPGSALVFAVDANPEHTAAAIASCGMRDDGNLHTKVVDHRQGMGWVVPRIVDLNTRYAPAAILLDPAGPAGSLIADLAQHGIEVEQVPAREMAQACGVFHDDVVNRDDEGNHAPRLRHTGQEVLTKALQVATSRPLGDAWAWNRRQATDDISPLVASTLAVHGFRARGLDEVLEPLFAFL
jgi:hypothetical protein